MSDQMEYINETARYIKDTKSRYEELEMRHLDPGQEVSLREELKIKIKSIHEKATALEKALLPITQKGRDLPSIEVERLIGRAWDGVHETMLACHLLLHDELRPANRTKIFHQMAVVNAVEIDSGPGAIGIAREIIHKAELGDYTDASLFNWVEEARADPDQMRKKIRWAMGVIYPDDLEANPQP